jgi:hypothetical protein
MDVKLKITLSKTSVKGENRLNGLLLAPIVGKLLT